MIEAAPPPWRVQTHHTLASTQDAAITAAHTGDPGRLAILAETQTAGRGSRGRAWSAPPGNLNLSILLRPPSPMPIGHWPLLAGIALHDALAPYAENLMLKWPNDLLLGGAKLGGILIDASLDPNGAPAWVVIGIGANLAAAPHIPGRETTCLPAPAPLPSAIAARILAAIDHHAAGTDIRSEWLRRAHKPGTELDIRTSIRHNRGVFETITASGALVLRGHPQPIASAEVFLASTALPDPAPHPHQIPGAAPCFL